MIYFVIRLKQSVKFNRGDEHPLPEERHQHILVDEYIELSHLPTYIKYPAKLRRVVVYDPEKDQTIKLITNQFTWTANTIGELYKPRCEIEIFFEEIKQLLKIKSILGTSANAILIQIWKVNIFHIIYFLLLLKISDFWLVPSQVLYQNLIKPERGQLTLRLKMYLSLLEAVYMH